MKKEPRLEAEVHARTVASFFSDKPLENLLVSAFLSGYRLCEVQHKLDVESHDVEMRKQLSLFDWNTK